VLVRVRAAAVHPGDLFFTEGVPYVFRIGYGLRGPRRKIPGFDVAGVAEAVGTKVKELRPGDEVFGNGTCAEHAAASEDALAPKPSGLTFEQAAAVPTTAVAALRGIRDAGSLQPGQRVLINGASGGVGTYAVQIAKALGAEVTGVCSTRNVDLVRSIGADHVIDYTQEDFTRSMRRYDVVLDNVLNHSPSATARLLTPTGTLIPNSVGNTGGLLAGLPRMARAAVMRRTSTVRCVVNRENLEALTALLESGKARVVIDKVYPLAEAGAAVAHMLGHHARGKVAIAV
jgi:NADPH:quinone reductase-like Zn-dependent oxidoreductase